MTENQQFPITVQEAKNQSRVTLKEEDELIQVYIRTATRLCEDFMQRSIVEKQYNHFQDRFPFLLSDELILEFGKVKSIESFSYTDEDGNAIDALASGLFETNLSVEPARIRPIDTEAWPTTKRTYNAVTLTYTAGYAADPTSLEIPQAVKMGIMWMVAHLFENREPMKKKVTLPDSVMMVLYPYRLIP